MTVIRLRDIFEDELGEAVSDRTWIRWKKRLNIWDESAADKVASVRMAARLRRENSRRKVDVVVVAFEREVQSRFPVNIICDGRDLYQYICDALGREVPRQTVYRWGEEIGVPFSMGQTYKPDHLVIWAKKIFPNYYARTA